MPEPPVVNASPLIFLAKADLLHLLQFAGREVLVPAAVVDEVCRRGRDDRTSQAITATEWLRTVEIRFIPELIQSWDLGKGESSVLAWAYENPGTIAVLDDLAARRCAASLGIPVAGTLGLVLIAKKRGQIPLARPVLERLL
nr:DUF3368 domain-containing protein [bacterium]